MAEPDERNSQRRQRPAPPHLPAEIFQGSQELMPDMPEHLNPSDGQEEQRMPRRRRLLLYGCSLTAQYGSALARHIQPLVPTDVWVCGLSGRTAAQLTRMSEAHAIEDEAGRVGKGIKVILADASHEGPFDVVLIMLGTNDLGMGYEAETVLSNIKKMHLMCHEHGVPTVVLSVPPNIACELDPVYHAKWRRVNDALQDWSHGDGPCANVILFVDTAHSVPLTEDGEFYNIDGVHFSFEGAERLGAEIASTLTSTLLVGGCQVLDNANVLP